MKTLFTIGNIHIPFFGTMIMLGVLAAWGILHYEAKRKNMDTEKTTDLLLWGFLGGILGARVGYILFYDLQQYIANPVEILKIYNGGLSIHGGIVGGTIAVLIYIRKNNEFKVLEVADMMAPALILAQAIGRVGCDVYGKVMEITRFWGIPVNGAVYHPAQVYEFLLDYLLFLILWNRRKKAKYQGQIFGIYIIGFAVIRSIVELFRNNPQVFGLLSVSHILSLVLIVFGIIWLKVVSKKQIPVRKSDNTNPSFRMISVVIVLIIVSIVTFYGVQLNL